MLHKQRRDGGREEGFTLIELLVVILIIGILAAIAIPSFLNQVSKANDASAKELARTAETVARNIGTDSNGSFSNVSTSEIASYEPTVQTSSGGGNAWLASASGDASSFTVVADSTDGNSYSIKYSNGAVTRTCTVTTTSQANAGGCEGLSGTSGTW